MCVSYQLLIPLVNQEVEEYWNHIGVRNSNEFKFEYNSIFPGYKALIIKSDRIIEISHFGLQPPWAKDRNMFRKLFNARSETVDSKPSFRNSFKKKRCLIPATAFFETAPDKTKKSISIHKKPVFFFAGIWEESFRDEERYPSFSMLTCEPNATMKEIHNRMPVILSDQNLNEWLDEKKSSEELKNMLIPYSETDLIIL